MNKKFLPNDIEGKLFHVIEECGEVLSAAGKLQRFGPLSVNPLLPVEKQESNIYWLIRELEDLETAIHKFKCHWVSVYGRPSGPLLQLQQPQPTDPKDE
jgi:hypothetical protein